MVRILLIEDSPSDRQLVRMALRGKAEMLAFSSLKAVPPELSADLTLADLCPCGLTVEQFLEALCQRFPGTPLIVMSGHEADSGMAGKVEKAGVRFIPKPDCFAALELTLATLIEEIKEASK